MQTFLPHADFVTSARALDSRRLGKQRVETFQILRAITWPSYGWKNHPATAMWRGFVPALVRYGLDICDVWAARGHADATRASLLAWTGGREPTWQRLVGTGQLPPWLGRLDFHRSHQAALVRKDPQAYRDAFPDVPGDLPYCWPGSVFPRWPLRRGRQEALDPADALGRLDQSEPSSEQRRVLELLVPPPAQSDRGGCVILELDGQPARVRAAAVLAALSTPGTTLWVSAGPDVPSRGRAPEPPQPAEPRTRAVSPSIARQPGAGDLDAMAAESAAWHSSDQEYRFLPASQWDGADLTGVGLVVADGVEVDARTLSAGVPLLRLRPDADPAS